MHCSSLHAGDLKQFIHQAKCCSAHRKWQHMTTYAPATGLEVADGMHKVTSPPSTLAALYMSMTM